jgi:cysteine desulfurase
MDGGGHERGMRSGTSECAGYRRLSGRPVRFAAGRWRPTGSASSRLRDRLERALLALDGARVNGSREHRLPQVTNISFEGVDGDALLAGLGKNVALSSGSACTSASMEPSYVLKALGLEDRLAHASLRLGLGSVHDGSRRWTTRSQRSGRPSPTSKKEKPAIIRRIFSRSWFRLNIFCPNH